MASLANREVWRARKQAALDRAQGAADLAADARARGDASAATQHEANETLQRAMALRWQQKLDAGE